MPSWARIPSAICRGLPAGAADRVVVALAVRRAAILPGRRLPGGLPAAARLAAARPAAGQPGAAAPAVRRLAPARPAARPPVCAAARCAAARAAAARAAAARCAAAAAGGCLDSGRVRGRGPDRRLNRHRLGGDILDRLVRRPRGGPGGRADARKACRRPGPAPRAARREGGPAGRRGAQRAADGEYGDLARKTGRTQPWQFRCQGMAFGQRRNAHRAAALTFTLYQLACFGPRTWHGSRCLITTE